MTPEELEPILKSFMEILSESKAIGVVGIDIEENEEDFRIKSKFELHERLNLKEGSEELNIILISIMTATILECFDKCKAEDVISRMTEVLSSFMQKEGITPLGNILH